MSDRRILDLATLSSFDLGFPKRDTNDFLGQVISGLNSVRSLGLAAFKPTVVGGGGSDTFEVVFQESGIPIIRNQNTFDGVDDGSLKLREGAALNVKLAIPITQSLLRTGAAIVFWLSKLGTPAKAAGGVAPSIGWDIVTDTAGAPSSTTVSQGWNLATADISGNLMAAMIGVNASLRDLANGNDYWIVIHGDYDADPLNCIQVHYNTVAGVSGCLEFDGGVWNSKVNEDLWFQLYQYHFTDVPNSDVEGGVIQYQEDINFVNSIDSALVRGIDLTKRKNYMRTKYNISGGNWYPLILVVPGLPVSGPVVGGDLQII